MKYRHVCGPARLSVAELTSIAYMGLVKAGRTFDAAKGIPFFQVAWCDMKDELRMEVRRAKAKKRGGGSERFVSDFDDEEGVATVEASVSDPDIGLFGDETNRMLSRMPERLRRILIMYAVEGMTMKEIGSVIGCSESRICQLYGLATAIAKAMIDPAKLDELQWVETKPPAGST